MPSSHHLDADDIARYHQQGCLGPFTLLTPDEMAPLRRRIKDDVLTSEGALVGHRGYLRHQDQRLVYDLCTHPGILGRLQSLLGPDLVLWQSSFWITAPGDTAVPWHQDDHYWPMEPPLTLTAWIAITRTTTETSCLHLVPGSHLERIPHVPVEGVRFVEQADPARVDESAAIAAEMAPGQMILFNDRVLHRSGVNQGPEPRIGLGARFTLPLVKLFQDRVPLFDGHRAYLVSGEDRFGLNRMGEPPGEPPAA